MIVENENLVSMSWNTYSISYVPCASYVPHDSACI